jgi:hypothetical protein
MEPFTVLALALAWAILAAMARERVGGRLTRER